MIHLGRQWREGKVRPLLGNGPHDRPVSRGLLLSRTVCDDASGSTVFLLAKILRRPSMRFLRHGRIYQSDVGLLLPQLGPGSPPPAGRPRTQAGRARREDRAPLIASMSSA